MTNSVSDYIVQYGSQGMPRGDETLEHFSEKPWSDYTASDYSIEQWHAACLIHQHEGPPTSKNQCKLPVKTPNGAVNKNGVHSAAAALAGARGGVHASSSEKSSAATALIRYYNQMNEKPPPSLLRHSTEEFVEHYGVKGMQWGIRNDRNRVRVSSDFKKTAPHRGKKVHSLSNKQLKAVNERINLEQNYSRMNPTTVKKGATAAKGVLALATTATTIYTMYNSPAGKALRNIGKKAASKKLTKKIASGASFG